MRPIDADALQERLKKKKPDPAAPRYDEVFNDALLRFKSMVHSAPTIKPERKKGEWIDITKTGWDSVWECSECGSLNLEDTHFCPDCGCDMGGEQDEP